MINMCLDLIESSIRVQVPGLEGFIPPSTTLAQLTAAVPHTIGPHLSLTLHLNTNGGMYTSSPQLSNPCTLLN